MADDLNNGYPQGGFSSRRWSVGQASPSDRERMAALAFSQEIINNAHTQADRILKAAERQAGEIVEKARREAGEIVRQAEAQARERLPDAAAGEPAPDEAQARLREYAARCAEACMAGLRQRQQETLDYISGQLQLLLGGPAAATPAPDPTPVPETVTPPDAEPDVSLGQIEAKVSAIAQQLAAFAEEADTEAQ